MLDNPTVSDKEYDVLYDRLLAMEKETRVVLGKYPTQRVGGAVLEELHQSIRIWPLSTAWIRPNQRGAAGMGSAAEKAERVPASFIRWNTSSTA